MFFGKVITQNTPFSFTPENVGEEAGEVLSLTNVVLAPGSVVSPLSYIQNGGSLYIKKDSEEFLVASLTKEAPQATINLFVSLADEVTLLVKGNATLHVVGFFEPDQDADLPFGEEDLEEEDEEEEEEEEEVPQVAQKPKQVAEKPKDNKQPAKPAQQTQVKPQ